MDSMLIRRILQIYLPFTTSFSSLKVALSRKYQKSSQIRFWLLKKISSKNVGMFCYSKMETSWSLRHVETGEEILLSKPFNKAGRSSGIEIVCRSSAVSRNHAEFLILADGTLHVRDFNVSFYLFSFFIDMNL